MVTSRNIFLFIIFFATNVFQKVDSIHLTPGNVIQYNQ